MKREIAEAELSWYWGVYESEIGLKSNFGSALEKWSVYAQASEDAEEGETVHIKRTPDFTWEDPFNAGTIAAANRARKIRTRLAKLGAQHRAALYWSIVLKQVWPHDPEIDEITRAAEYNRACQLYKDALALYCRDE